MSAQHISNHMPGINIEIPWSLQALLGSQGIRKHPGVVARQLIWQERDLFTQCSDSQLEYVWLDSQLHEDLDLANKTQIEAIVAEVYKLAQNDPHRMALSNYPENTAIAICFMAGRSLCRIFELNQTLPAWCPLATMHDRALTTVRGEIRRWAREQPYWKEKSFGEWTGLDFPSVSDGYVQNEGTLHYIKHENISQNLKTA